jgi:hypothetical protein
MRPDGSNLKVVAGGLRGPVGLAFDRNWELFTNDNDHETLNTFVELTSWGPETARGHLDYARHGYRIGLAALVQQVLPLVLPDSELLGNIVGHLMSVFAGFPGVSIAHDVPA